MISQQMRKALGAGTTAIAGVVLFGIKGLESSTNIFNTGITFGMILGIGSIIVALAIYKNWI